jgi:hypothetical protein
MSLYTQLINSFIKIIILGSSTQNELILGGLGYNLLNNINKINYKSYYLNDYDTNNDFVIYNTPNTYDTNLITSTNENIRNIYTMEGNENNISSTEPYKMSINNLKKYFYKTFIPGTSVARSESAQTEDEINNINNIIGENKDFLYRFARLSLLAPLILHENRNNQKILDDIRTNFNNMTDNLKQIIGFTDERLSMYRAFFILILGQNQNR